MTNKKSILFYGVIITQLQTEHCIRCRGKQLQLGAMFSMIGVCNKELDLYQSCCSSGKVFIYAT